jgi:drug/metabolite transporter (DMT)-like permease
MDNTIDIPLAGTRGFGDRSPTIVSSAICAGRVGPMTMGLLGALASAVFYGVASVLQAVAARAAPQTRDVDPRLLLRLLRRAPFLGGVLLDIAGFAAEFTALRTVPVFLVQAVVASSLAVTALVAVPVLKARLRPREWAAVAAVCAGLALLAVSTGREGSAPVGDGFRLALLGCVVVLAAVGFGAGRLGDPARSAVLGLVAGLGFGVVALAVRALPDLSPAHLVRDPATYALVGGGVIAFLFFATGLQRGAVTVTTGAMVVGETLAPAAVGVLLLGDRTRPGFAPVAVAGFIVAVAATLALARFGEVAPSPER